MTAQENAQSGISINTINKNGPTRPSRNNFAQTKAEIDHLESISTSMDIAEAGGEDLVQIRKSLRNTAISNAITGGKKVKITSARSTTFPVTDSISMSGKNNYQNEELDFKFCQRWRLVVSREGNPPAPM